MKNNGFERNSGKGRSSGQDRASAGKSGAQKGRGGSDRSYSDNRKFSGGKDTFGGKKPADFANKRPLTKSFDKRQEKAPDMKRDFFEDDDSEQYGVFQLEGRNSVLEALRNDKPVDTLLIKKGEYEGTIRVITAIAREKGILIKEMSVEKLNSISRTNNHQGVIAICAAQAYVTVDEMLESAKESGKQPFILLLDGITDPHNLGAIIRTAESAGVTGIVIPKRRAVGLTPVVGKVAAGALEYVKVARVANIASTIEELKKKGLWIYCADTEGDNLFETNMSGASAIVIGGEGEGVSRLVREKCDFVVKIPMFGKIGSLNASVAASLMMYEVVRRREQPVGK